MMHTWPSATLYVVLLVVLFESRVVAGRATLPLARFLTFFTIGSLGAALASVVLQRIAMLFLSPKIVSWTLGPAIEEIAKAGAVLVFLYVLKDWRRLTIADLALMGLAVGLGFDFTESNLRLLAGGKLADQVRPEFFPLFRDAGMVDYPIRWAGHGVAPAMLCLVAASGRRLWPRHPAVGWLLVLCAFAVVTFDHGMLNWKAAHSSLIKGVEPAAPWAESLYTLTWHGGIELLILPVALIVASWFEGRACWSAAGGDRSLLLPNETRPRVLVEWLIAWARFKDGRRALGAMLEFFRVRRAYLLSRLELARTPDDPQLRSISDRLRMQTVACRDAASAAPGGAWLPSGPEFSAGAVAWCKRMRWVLFSGALVIVFFTISPRIMPDWMKALLFGKPMAFVMAAASVGFVTWRVRSFMGQAKPEAGQASADAVVGYHAQAMLLGFSVLASAIAVLSLAVDANALVPAVAAFVSDATRDWFEVGGTPTAPLSGGGMFGASNPDPPPKAPEPRPRDQPKPARPGDPKVQIIGDPEFLKRDGASPPHPRTVEKPGTRNRDAHSPINIEPPDDDLLKRYMGDRPEDAPYDAARERATRKGMREKAEDEHVRSPPVSAFPPLPPLPPSADDDKPHRMRIAQGFYDDYDRAVKALDDPNLSQADRNQWEGIRDEAKKYIDLYEKTRPEGIDAVERAINDAFRGDAKDEYEKGAWELGKQALPLVGGEALGALAKIPVAQRAMNWLGDKLGRLADWVGTGGKGYSASTLDRVEAAGKGVASALGGVPDGPPTAPTIVAPEGELPPIRERLPEAAPQRPARWDAPTKVAGPGEAPSRPGDPTEYLPELEKPTPPEPPKYSPDAPTGAPIDTPEARATTRLEDNPGPGGGKANPRVLNEQELKAQLDNARAEQEAAERALKSAQDDRAVISDPNAEASHVREAVAREQERARRKALEKIADWQQTPHPVTGGPQMDDIFDMKVGETSESAAERFALKSSLTDTPYSPGAAAVNLEGSASQLDRLVSGLGKEIKLAPTEANVRALYADYEKAIGRVKKGLDIFPDYWDRADGKWEVATIKHHLENAPYRDLDYWLTRLKQLGK